MITDTMVREALSHVPFNLHGRDKWEFIANFLNAAIAEPDKFCPCCGVSPNGVYLDGAGFPIQS